MGHAYAFLFFWIHVIHSASLIFGFSIGQNKMLNSASVSFSAKTTLLSSAPIRFRSLEWQWLQLGHKQICTLPRQITMPASHHWVYYRPVALPAAQPTASKHWRQHKCQQKSMTKPSMSLVHDCVSHSRVMSHFQHTLCMLHSICCDICYMQHKSRPMIARVHIVQITSHWCCVKRWDNRMHNYEQMH